MNDKTKKQKKRQINKKELWNKFEQEEYGKKKLEIECVFRKEGERELCECCNSTLAIIDEGFLTCTNSKCGVIYKDSIDSGAEWRYYGADDNNSGDPTRCGMPINPLLVESSF